MSKHNRLQIYRTITRLMFWKYVAPCSKHLWNWWYFVGSWTFDICALENGVASIVNISMFSPCPSLCNTCRETIKILWDLEFGHVGMRDLGALFFLDSLITRVFQSISGLWCSNQAGPKTTRFSELLIRMKEIVLTTSTGSDSSTASFDTIGHSSMTVTEVGHKTVFMCEGKFLIHETMVVSWIQRSIGKRL